MRRNQFVAGITGAMAFVATGTGVFGLTNNNDEYESKKLLINERCEKIMAQFLPFPHSKPCDALESFVTIWHKPNGFHCIARPGLFVIPDYDKFNMYGARAVDLTQYEYNYSKLLRIKSSFRYDDVPRPDSYLSSEYEYKLANNTWCTFKYKFS